MKKYQIIYADPPWKIHFLGRKLTRPNQHSKYEFMDVEDIKNLPIRNIVNKNGCHLFLWATHKYLPYAFEVMKSWGFKYHCCLTWDKTYGITPYSFMFSTEFCLYGQIPDKWIKPKGFGIKTLITEKPTEHSRKPFAMRKLILDYCGNLPRLELFARERKDMFGSDLEGWDVWGNEVESDIELKQEIK